MPHVVLRNAFTRRFSGSVACLLWLACCSGLGVAAADDDGSAGAPERVIDFSTLHRKVMCGYQGWFRCPGDPVNQGWQHWSRNRRRIGPDTLTFEMWPDMTEYAPDEKYAAPG